jgi:hypothetical protein
VLGFLQMAADLLHAPALKGVAIAAAASPAPRVFSPVNGFESYSRTFFLEWTDRAGQFHSVQVTPGRAAGLRGPYNRRNMYGAVLANGPVTQTDSAVRPMFESVFRYALCGKAPMLRELGVDPAQVAGPLRLRLVPRAGSNTGNMPLTFEAPCS